MKSGTGRQPRVLQRTIIFDQKQKSSTRQIQFDASSHTSSDIPYFRSGFIHRIVGQFFVCRENFSSQNSHVRARFVSLRICQFIINHCRKYSRGELKFCRIFISYFTMACIFSTTAYIFCLQFCVIEIRQHSKTNNYWSSLIKLLLVNSLASDDLRR